MPLKPVPDGNTRKQLAREVRDEATYVGHARSAVTHQANNGEADALNPPWGTFTKGLAHNEFGEAVPGDVATLIAQINQSSSNSPGVSPFPLTYTTKVSAPFPVKKFSGTYRWPFVGPMGEMKLAGMQGTARSWESPLAGHTFEINGPDADEFAMPPAPTIGSAELTAEIGEVYGMALLRDVPFAKWNAAAGDPDGDKVRGIVALLSELDFFKGHAGDATDNAQSPRARGRRRHRFVGTGESGTANYGLTPGNLFRGSTVGAHQGPYVSQFLLIGNEERPMGTPPGGAEARRGAGADTARTVQQRSVSTDALTRAGQFGDVHRGRTAPRRAAPTDETAAEAVKTAKHGVIRYGIQGISQRFPPHQEGVDHLTDWASWLDVQNGANRKELFDLYEDEPRFPMTGRDLATYVHFDALYQAYLNACLIMLGAGVAVDIGLPEGKGHPTRDGFALFGGPHILTLLTEVSTRALKAVRRQKYQVHLRARPEALAAALTLAWNNPSGCNLGNAKPALDSMVAALNRKPGGTPKGLLDRIAAHNKAQNEEWQKSQPVGHGWIDVDKNGLLPMAFPEGSPMHPSYGAGHATVAGACVTVLKAFFEMYDVPKEITVGGRAIPVNRQSVPYSVFAPQLRSFRPGSGTNPDLVPQGNALPDPFFGNESTMKGVIDPTGMGADEAYEADPAAGGKTLKIWGTASSLKIQHELDKLAANIAIARDFAGVHYYTDYYESLRLGERIAVAMLQEQMLTYREPVSMRFRSFDGDYVTIVGTGGSRHSEHDASDPIDAVVSVWDANKVFIADTREWWQRAMR